MLTAVVGINWGDEGKGRMVDLLSEDYDVVCRYQGGNNAGHTVVNERGKFILNLLPSGILREGVANVMGPGMVIDIEHLNHELEHIAAQGVVPGEDALIISDRATICMPYDKLQDGLEEDRLADRKFGSTRRGIAPVYADKYMKKALRMGDLLHTEGLKERLRDIVEWKNLTLRSYGAEADAGEMYDWLMKYGEALLPRIKDTTEYLHDAIEKRGADVMFEAQLGALRDIDFGIYPYPSSSTTLAAYAPIGAGRPRPQARPRRRHYEGVLELRRRGPLHLRVLRRRGGEAPRPRRRVRRGHGQAPGASAASTSSRAATACASRARPSSRSRSSTSSPATATSPSARTMRWDGKITDSFPTGGALERAKPVYEYLPGFEGDISGCRSFGELPKAAQDYVNFCEDAVGCPIKYVSVGADREQIIVR